MSSLPDSKPQDAANLDDSTPTPTPNNSVFSLSKWLPRYFHPDYTDDETICDEMAGDIHAAIRNERCMDTPTQRTETIVPTSTNEVPEEQ